MLSITQNNLVKDVWWLAYHHNKQNYLGQQRHLRHINYAKFKMENQNEEVSLF